MMTGDEMERLQGAGQRGMEVVLFVIIVVMIVIDLFVVCAQNTYGTNTYRYSFRR